MKYDLRLKGTVGYWNFNKDQVDNLLDRMADQEVHVLIDSLGGRVNDALSISSAFANHGNVHVHYRGMNASAATISSMGAKHISIDASALYLVHKCSMFVFEWDSLNADQLIQKAEEYKKMASDAEKIDLTIATMYAKRCKKSVKELHDLMSENKWLTAQEALEWGFVDEVIEEGSKEIHLTASVATAMAAEGMPVPAMDVEADGFLEKITAILQKVFKGSTPKSDDTEGAPAIAQAQAAAEPAAPAQTSEQTDNTNNPNSQNVMKKTFLMVAAVLAAAMQAALPEASEEGKFALDEGQLDALEAALAQAKADKEAAETAKAALETELANAKAEIDELKKEPADKNEKVVEAEKKPSDEPENDAERMAANIAEARKMLGLTD